MSQGAWHLCPLLVTSFQLTRTGIIMSQVPMCAREKKQVTVGDSPLAPAPSLQPASASAMKRELGLLTLSSGSLLSTAQSCADGLSLAVC